MHENFINVSLKFHMYRMNIIVILLSKIFTMKIHQLDVYIL